MTIEEPGALLARSGCGREEILQRLLTMLILGFYPKWDSRTPPTDDGLRFLRTLDELAYGQASDLAGAVFVDEFKLPARPSDKESAWPDYAVLTDDRLWIIELKTEHGSHRATQLPWYVELGRNHYPDHRLDLTYLTGSYTYPAVDMPNGCRYAHLSWAEVLPLIGKVWGSAADIDSIVNSIGLSWTEWKATRLESASAATARAPHVGAAVAVVERPSVKETSADPVGDAVAIARLTAADHEQRALDFRAGSLWDLHALRDLVNGRTLEAAAAEPDLGHVKAWVWRAETSDGVPLTLAGTETNCELRLSRYRTSR